MLAFAGLACAGPGAMHSAAPAPDPPLRSSGAEIIELIPAPQTVALPRPGDRTGVGTPTTPTIAAAYRARMAGAYDQALTLTEQAQRALSADASTVDRWWLESFRLRLLFEDARIDLAAAALPGFRALEQEVFANDLVAAVLQADLDLYSQRLSAARARYRGVLSRVDQAQAGESAWTSARATRHQAYRLEARARAQAGISLSYLFAGDCAAALAWADQAHREQSRWLGRAQSLAYRLFAEPGPDAIHGYGWTLALLGASRICHSGKLEPSLTLFRHALDHFAAVRFADGPLVVAGFLEFAAARAGALRRPTEVIGILPAAAAAASQSTPSNADRATSVQGLPADLVARLPATGMHVGRPAPQQRKPSAGSRQLQRDYRLPPAGRLNSIGVAVGANLQAALDAYLAGDGDAALEALARAATEPQSALSAWHLSYTRAQVLIMMGLAADAETELERGAELEIAALGTNINSRALRGEARAWLGDYAAARADFEQVLAALGDWRPPTRILTPPADITQLVVLTRALLRATVGRAMTESLAGDYAAALPWAERAETLLAAVFDVVLHPAYGPWLAIDSDLFYGRGLNLGIAGSAHLVTRGDTEAAAALFERAREMFDRVAFSSGRIIVAGMRARALLDLGQAERALRLADTTAALAASQQLPDLAWQMHALRGRALLELDRPQAAESALRNAQTGLAAVAGALASDRSKRRFGIGKEYLTQQLSRLTLARGAWQQTYADLERGRALAFVDLLGARAANGWGPAARLSEQIRQIDRQLRRLRLLRAAPGPTAPNPQAEAELARQREKLIERLRSVDSEVAASLSVVDGRLHEVQTQLTADQAMVYFLPQDDERSKLAFLLIEHDSLRRIETDLGARQLLRTLQLLRASSTAELARIQARRATQLSRSLRLETWLQHRRLYVVPSGVAHYLPWGALNLPDEVEVVVVPTGNWLLRIAPPLAPNGSAVVVGDPAFGGQYAQLPGARSEAEMVAAHFDTGALLGEDATESAVRQSVGSGVDVLHLATHGLFDTREPMRSAIILSDSGATRALTAASLYARPLRARLVVLSACDTGLGRFEAGDDYLGLARSFYLGGTRTVVNTLWPVEDKATFEFMREFYRHARHGRYGKAWAKARSSLREAGYSPNVYGAFVLGGSAGG